MDTQTITRKIRIYPIGDKEEVDRVYKYIRDGMYNQNKAYNILISNVYSAMYSGKSNEEIKMIYKRGQRLPKENNPDYSLYKFDEITFPKGMMVQSSICQSVKADIKKSVKDGLLKGKVSLPNKKKDAPLIIESRQFCFYHKYETDEEFYNKLYTTDVEIFMKFVNKIVFKVVLGNVKDSYELRSVFQNIFEGKYHVQGSSIQFDNTGKKIILNLSMSIQKNSIYLDENVVVGVDLGVAIPAVCALNNNTYIKQSIGSKDDFLRVRTKIQAQKRQLQRSIKYSNGGHGRNKKLKTLDKFTKYEKNFVQTYNHMVSKNVVEFAVKNNAKYINIEDLSGYHANDFILRNWSFYQLQEYITYKANLYGIEVRKINPYHTSQICSCCGHWEEGQRVTQSKFICKNPECKNYGKEINADFNAARNIAMSIDFI